MSVTQRLALAASLAAAGAASASVLQTQVALPGKNVPKYVDPLPVFGPPQPGTAGAAGAAIPRVSATCPVPSPGAPPAPGCSAHTALDQTTIQTRDVAVTEFQQRILPAATYPPRYASGTWVWGYQVGDAPPLYPGVTLEARKGTPSYVRFVNQVPAASQLRRYLTVDQTIHWADPGGVACMAYVNTVAPNGTIAYPAECWSPYGGTLPTVAHLHGAETPGEFDGGPEQWWTPDGRKGATYRSYVATDTDAATYWYANQQPATTLWFHDHALGSTRINVYAGLAAFYLLRDDPRVNGAIDTGAQVPGGLPAGPYEREIVIQDRQFDTNGQLLFPDGQPAGLNGPPTNPLVHPYWIPEFLGDVIVVNGKSWPYLDVEPRRYRFRFLNGSNARFYQLALVDAATGAWGPPIWQIGTDGGLLASAVMLNDPAALAAGAIRPELLVAPGERADVVVDFSGLPAGTTFVLKNVARAPYPKGAPPDPQTSGQVMQFRVRLPLAAGGDPSCAPQACVLRGPATPLYRLANADGTLPRAVKPDVRRQLVLREIEGAGGPVEVLLNNTKWMGLKESTLQPMPMPDGTTMAMGQPVDGAAELSHMNYVTETPRVSATEEWEIINTTADAHPIHVHLVQFQLLNRQPYRANRYLTDWSALLLANGKGVGDGPPSPYGTTTDAKGAPIAVAPGQPPVVGGNVDVTPYLQQAPTGPLPNEFGWKDTVVMYPGEVTRILVRFAPQTLAPGTTVAGTPWTAYGTSWSPERPYGSFTAASPGYVWHCHILDHEDNEMMRPYVVTR